MRSASTYLNACCIALLVLSSTIVAGGCGEKDQTVTPAEMRIALDSLGSGYAARYRMLDHYDDQLAAGTISADEPRKETKFCLAREHVTLPSECDGLIAAGGWADVIVHTQAHSMNDPALGRLVSKLRPLAPDVE